MVSGMKQPHLHLLYLLTIFAHSSSTFRRHIDLDHPSLPDASQVRLVLLDFLLCTSCQRFR